MPRYRVGGWGEGAATTLLEHVQRQTKRREEEEDQQREWDRELRKIVLSNPDDYNPPYVEALLSGQPTSGISPLATTAPFDYSALRPGQTYSQKVRGGTLTTQGGYSVPEDMPLLTPDATDEEKTAYLDRLNPEDQEIIKGLADYTLDPTKTSSLMRGNQRQRLLALTKRYAPDFDMKSFTAAQQYANPNTKVGQNITSLNTLVGHIGYLQDALGNLEASGQPLENAVILTARNLTGDPTITNYDVAKEVVDNEAQRALSGVGVTQQGMERQGAILPRRRFGKQQAEQYVRAMSHILQARLGALESGYRQQIRRDPRDLITYPESRQILTRVFGGPGGKGNDFASEQEALSANLPLGTHITINGRPAIIE